MTERGDRNSDVFISTKMDTSTNSTTTQSLTTRETKADALTGGGRAGIVIGVVLFLILTIVAIIILYKRRLLPGRLKKSEPVVFSFNTGFQRLVDLPSSVRRSDIQYKDSQSDLASELTSLGGSTLSRSTNLSRLSSITLPLGNEPEEASRPWKGHTRPKSADNPHLTIHDYNMYEQYRRNSQCTPRYIPSSRVTPNRSNYRTQDCYYIPASFDYTPRTNAVSTVNYRPSRHIDRQLNVFYSWSISEQPERTRVHEHRVGRDLRHQ